MRYVIEKLVIENEIVFNLKDNELLSEGKIIPSMGNNLIQLSLHGRSVISPPPDLSMLKTETLAKYKYGIPILFPPNRVAKGKFKFDGRKYTLPINDPPHHIHGEIAEKEWKVVDYGANEHKGAFIISELSLEEHLDIYNYFPHKLIFQMTYQIKDGNLSSVGKIMNNGLEVAPFFFGFHPYFNISEENGEMQFIVSASEEWPVTSQAFVTGLPKRTELVQKLSDGISVNQFPPLSAKLVTLDDDNHFCEIVNQKEKYRIRFDVGDLFRYVVIFRPDWSDSISFEPYTSVTDAFNLPWSYEKTGKRGLKPGKIVEFNWSLKLEDCSFE